MSRRAAAARDEDARSTRDVILDAAERRFAERGFAGVSMRGIAADAGLRNQASLYSHFRHKRALYEAVLARGVESLATLLTENNAAVRDRRTILHRERFEASLDRLLDYLEAHPHLPRLIQRAGLDDSRYLRDTASRLLQPLYAQGMRTLADTRAPWDPTELPQVAAGIYNLIFGYFANAALLEAVVQKDPRSPVAIARQRRFLKKAVAGLLGVSASGRTRSSDTFRNG